MALLDTDPNPERSSSKGNLEGSAAASAFFTASASNSSAPVRAMLRDAQQLGRWKVP